MVFGREEFIMRNGNNIILKEEIRECRKRGGRNPRASAGNRGRLLLTELIIGTALSFCSAGCAPLSVDNTPEVTIPDGYEGFIPGEMNEKELNEWWRLFNDDYLSYLIEKAVISNTDIRTARMRYGQALHEAGISEADLGPSAVLHGKGAGGRSDVESSGRRYDSTDSQAVLMTGLQASWEPDLFGEKQSKLDAARYRALAAQDAVNAVRTSVTALLARKYFEILYLRERKAVLNDGISNLKRLRSYAAGRFSAGQATMYDLTDIDAGITDMEAQLSVLDDATASAVRAVAVLAGEPPQSFSPEKMSGGLPGKIPLPPAGAVPGELLLRRPDLLSKRNEVNAAASMTAAAMADLYPRFEISFLGQLGRIEMHSRPDIDFGVGFITGSVSVPVFTNGRIRARIEAENASMKAALAEYDGLILKALKEVDDGYYGVMKLGERAEKLKKGRAEAEKLLADADKLFKYGMAEFDKKIEAKNRIISFDEKICETEFNRIVRLIDLYKALGGGWDYPAGKEAGVHGAAEAEEGKADYTFIR